jgi:uncharacterized protein YigE (DUF2233 family)
MIPFSAAAWPAINSKDQDRQQIRRGWDGRMSIGMRFAGRLRRSRRLILLLTLPALGCGDPQAGAGAEAAPEVTAKAAPQPAREPPRKLAPKLVLGAVSRAGAPACAQRRFEGTMFTVCRFDTANDELRLAWRGRARGALRSFAALEAELGKDARRVRFAMNAGMYDEAGKPIGLYVEQSKELKKLNLKEGPGNFHLKPNGVFAADAAGRVSVTDSSRFRSRVRAPQWATQSGPMLVIDGKLHPKFDANGQSHYVRNGVGVRDSSTALFAISEEPVSFGRFARLFRDALGCANALYFDGNVSSLWDPRSGRQDAASDLGPMIVVLAKRSTRRQN